MSFDEPSQFLGGWGFNGSCCGETTLTAENCEFTNAYFGNGCGTIKALNFSDCVIGEGTRLNATREYASAQYVFTRTTIHGSFRDFASGFYDYYDCPALMYDESCWNWVSVPFQFQEGKVVDTHQPAARSQSVSAYSPFPRGRSFIRRLNLPAAGNFQAKSPQNTVL